ncbi:MAG: hypothetical protein ACLFUB_18445 [Cyclobacteriaceae bacterium]
MAPKRHFLSNAYEYFNTLTMVFYLMVSVPLLFFIIVYLSYQEEGGLQPTQRMNVVEHVLLPAAIIISLVMPFVMYRRQLQARRPMDGFRAKLRTFHQLSFYRYGWLTLANFLAVLGMYYTGEQLFAGLYAIALVVFSLHRPTASRIIKDTKLNEQEKEWLRSDKNFDELP